MGIRRVVQPGRGRSGSRRRLGRVRRGWEIGVPPDTLGHVVEDRVAGVGMPHVGRHGHVRVHGVGVLGVSVVCRGGVGAAHVPAH